MRLAVVAATALLLQRAGIAADVSGTLTGDLSLPAGQHRLTGNLTIEATGSLTLQPGAELRATGSFVISVYGTLRASGTSAQPCLIAAAAARPGSWQGIVAFSGATLSLTYTTVAGAGTNVTANGCNLALNGCVIRDCARDGVAVYGPSSVNISECSFVSCGRRGLFLETSDVTGQIGKCSFSAVGEYPIVAKATLVELLVGPFSLSNVALPLIGVSCSADEDITDADTWRSLGIDYDLTAGSSDELLVAPSGSLTLEPGVRLRCDRVRVEGTVSCAAGGSQVVLYGPRGPNGTAGDWYGIEVAGGHCELRNCVVRDAETCIRLSGGSLVLDSSTLHRAEFDGVWTTGPAQLTITRCTFSNLGRSGLRVTDGAAQGLVEWTTFARCGEWPVLIKPNAVGILGGGLTFTDNARQAIGVVCTDATDVVRTQQWQGQPVPYDLAADPSARVVTVSKAARLTIMGGALLLNGGLVVQGGLDLAGSPDALVVLASSTSEPTPGITYSPDSSGAATWVDISGATVGITIRDASPRLDHVAAHDNQADGLFVTGARAAPVVTWSSFTRNARYGVRIEDEAQPNLGNVGNTSPMDDGYNEIHSNGAAYDLRNTSTKTIMAENNWWGADVASAIKARIWDRDENPSVGLVDIWPFLTSRPNQAPTLRWLGSAPYANAGVAPLLGSPSTVFTYKVLYSDADGDPPRYVRVHILLSGRPIEGSPFDMTQASGASDYRAGVVFEFSTKLAVGRSYTYFFEAADRSLQAVGEPTQPQDGPIVNRRPTLSWVGSSSYASDGVDPDTGYDDTEFDFRVKYTDADGDAPSGVFLYVYLNGQPVAGSPFAMTKLSGDYSAGAVYQRRLTLTQGSTSGYQYRFSASDGLEAATGEPTQFHSGPSVRWRPRLTYVASVGYERDGVEPQVAAVGTDFRFLVRYTHGGGRNPAFVRLHLQLNGQEVSGSPFDMAPADDTPVAQGRTYSVSVRVPAGRGYVHWFEASDGTLAASGPATQPAEGPLSDRPPTLSFPATGPAKEDGLYPDSGASGSTEFIWEVVYRDADGDAPRYVGLLLFLDGRELPESPIIMEPVPGGDVTRGKTYRVSRRLTQLGKWEYRFVASDGYAPATGAPTQRRQAPTVTGGIELAYPRVGPLGDRGQMPAVGTPGLTPFSFYVTYRHVEGTAPQWVRVKIRLANSATNVKSFGMTALDGADFRVGRTYSRTVELDGTPCTYWFEASDGKAVCRTDELPGPAFNHAPTVEWAGGQHWTNTGVYPASGDLTTSFEFRVLYRDPDGDPPAQAYVIVYRPDDPRSQQVVWLSPLASGNVDYRAGVVYQAFLKPGQAGSYRYTFRLNDGYAQATGPPALEHDGPSVAATGTSIVALTGVVACAGPRLATVRCTTSVDNCQVRGSVLNVAGRKVADLLLLRQDRREVVLAWNYTNAAGSRVPPGRYMILLEAASPCGSLARAVTVLQVGGR